MIDRIRKKAGRFGRRRVSTPVFQDGNWFIKPRPVFLSQFADRTRVDSFLSEPALLASDTHWADFGFRDVEEYGFWAPRLCGLVCVKMILDGVGAASEDTVASLVEKGVKRGGYVIRDKNGEFVDKGWFYRPLVNLAGEFGLRGEVIGSLTIDELCGLVAQGRAVVPSVHPGVIRGDAETLSEGETAGGHLVVVIGMRWRQGRCAGFYVHNPSGRTAAWQESVFIPIERFDVAFAGRGFALWTGKSSVALEAAA